MTFADDDLTSDSFLGGRLEVRQPRAGYRAGVDPVLLAAAVPARSGETVLELGCGVGVAALCLGRRVPGIVLSGVEIQPDYAALARENAAANGIALEVVEGDIARLPAHVRSLTFDHVIANPPYYRRDLGPASTDSGRELALGEIVPLALWIDSGLRRLRPGGRFTVIQRADRISDVLSAFGGRQASLTVLPIAPREGREATRVIVAARKGGRAALRLLAPLVLHEGQAHLRDGEDYTETVKAVLRDGAPLPNWPP